MPTTAKHSQHWMEDPESTWKYENEIKYVRIKNRKKNLIICRRHDYLQ